MARLLAHAVELLVDVRAIAQSRKPGFSKTLLSASLETRGIGYVHLRGLGTPKEGRIATRAGNRPELRRIFTRHMATEPARQDFARLATLAAERRCCLLCFERDHTACHRTIVADSLSERTGISVVHI